jgi:hypothetical protein
MDFFIVTSDSKLFDFDKKQLESITQENIIRHGLLIHSDVSDFNGEMITLMTTIEIGRVKEGEIDIAKPERLLTFRGKTVFKLQEPSIFTFGITDHAVSVMEALITLSQAHAYGAFNVTVREMNLARLPMEVSPVDKYLYDITAFLTEHIK